MTVDPAPKTPDPKKPGQDPDHPDYAHAHDAQADRSRVELWVILAIVVVVLVGGFVWRATTGAKPAPQAGWNRGDPSSAPPETAAAGAGLPVRGVGTAPPSRPAAP